MKTGVASGVITCSQAGGTWAGPGPVPRRVHRSPAHGMDRRPTPWSRAQIPAPPFRALEGSLPEVGASQPPGLSCAGFVDAVGL